jgi:hypothetical protein
LSPADSFTNNKNTCDSGAVCYTFNTLRIFRKGWDLERETNVRVIFSSAFQNTGIHSATPKITALKRQLKEADHAENTMTLVEFSTRDSK